MNMTIIDHWSIKICITTAMDTPIKAITVAIAGDHIPTITKVRVSKKVTKSPVFPNFLKTSEPLICRVSKGNKLPPIVTEDVAIIELLSGLSGAATRIDPALPVVQLKFSTDCELINCLEKLKDSSH